MIVTPAPVAGCVPALDIMLPIFSMALDQEQLQATFNAVDQFWNMDYSACGFPYAGMANAPWPWVKSGQATMDELGFPRDKIVHVFPWHVRRASARAPTATDCTFSVLSLC